MNEQQLRSSLLSWYQEALKGNTAPLEAIHHAMETFFLFDMISSEIYDLSLYLMQNLFEIGKIESAVMNHNTSDYEIESEVIPFA